MRKPTLKSIKGDEERHYVNISTKRESWKTLRAMMKNQCIKTYSQAFTAMLQQAIRQGHIGQW